MFLNNEQRTFLVKRYLETNDTDLVLREFENRFPVRQLPNKRTILQNCSKQKVFTTPPQSLENLCKRKTESFNNLRRNPEFVKNSIVKCIEKSRNVSIIKVKIFIQRHISIRTIKDFGLYRIPKLYFKN